MMRRLPLILGWMLLWACGTDDSATHRGLDLGIIQDAQVPPLDRPDLGTQPDAGDAPLADPVAPLPESQEPPPCGTAVERASALISNPALNSKAQRFDRVFSLLKAVAMASMLI